MYKKLAIIGALFLAAQNVQASASVSGNLAHSNDYDLIPFNVSASSPVDIWTDSFIPGFDPILTVYDSTGTLIAQDDDNPIFAGQDFWDSTIQFGSLAAGNYTLAVTMFAFFPAGNLATDFVGLVTGDPLDDVTGQWHVNFTGDYVTAVPEPETYAMLLAGLGLLGFMAHRRKHTVV